LALALDGSQLDWQVASAAHIFQAIETVFSAVEYLTLQYDRRLISSEWNNEADRIQWRELFRTFRVVKALSVEEELVGQKSLALCNQAKENRPRSCYPNCRNSHIIQQTLPTTRSLNSLKPARKQAAP
jgi:hypothetical protein